MARLGDFLQGFEAARLGNQQADVSTLQQAGALQKIFAQQQAAEEDRELRSVVAQAGGDPARAIEALIRSGTPKALALAAQLRGLLPKPAEPFTLTPGAKRFDPSGQVVAEAQVATPTPAPFTLAPGGTRFDAEGRPIASVPATPEAPQAVTPATIQDPNDPNSTLVIDARTNRVLGKGPKLTQTGSAQQKLELALPQARLRVRSAIQGIERLDSAIAELDADPGLTNITGTLFGRTPNITNLATGAQAKLDSIKSQIFQSSLLAMREASKTGGAVGNVSDREGDKLERTIAALDQAQGTPDFRRQLAKARQQLRLSKEIITAAFEEQFGGVQTPTQPAGTPASQLTPEEQRELEELRRRFGRGR